MPKVKVFEKRFTGLCILKVVVGSNTPMDGDAGHGGRTILVLENEGGCAWDVEVDGKKIENPKRITIVMHGDDEAERLVEALEFVVKVLRMQIDSRNEKGYEIEVE